MGLLAKVFREMCTSEETRLYGLYYEHKESTCSYLLLRRTHGADKLIGLQQLLISSSALKAYGLGLSVNRPTGATAVDRGLDQIAYQQQPCLVPCKR